MRRRRRRRSKGKERMEGRVDIIDLREEERKKNEEWRDETETEMKNEE